MNGKSIKSDAIQRVRGMAENPDIVRLGKVHPGAFIKKGKNESGTAAQTASCADTAQEAFLLVTSRSPQKKIKTGGTQYVPL